MSSVNDFVIKNGVLEKYIGEGGDVIIPDGVKSIGNGAFHGYIGLTSVTIPDSVKSIGDSAFEDCSNLTGVMIPDSVTSIGDGAFSGCSSLTSITIPDGVTSIGDDAFWCCTNLTSVTIPDSVTSIGYQAFIGCKSLTNVIVSSGATCIEGHEFKECKGLADKLGFVIVGGILCDYYGSRRNVVIPDCVTSIGYSAFEDCNNLTSITIPGSVTNIGDGAFKGCSSLTSITIPDGVANIGDRAFEGCNSLKSIMIPDGVTVIGDETFEGCSSLTSIKIPDSVTSIGDRAFAGCSSLTSLSIPDGVRHIGDGAFQDCKKLRSLEMGRSPAKFANDVFGTQLPPGLVNQLVTIYPRMTDNAIKQSILKKRTWNKIAPELRMKIFSDRHGEQLETAYAQLMESSDLELLGETILKRMDKTTPSGKDCSAAAAHMTIFRDAAKDVILKGLYEKLKRCKAGKTALIPVEADTLMMQKIGNRSISPAMKIVLSAMNVEAINEQDIEKKWKEYYGLTIKDLPRVYYNNGSMVEPQVMAWLLMAHEKLVQRERVFPDVEPAYEEIGLRPEAEEIVALLNSESFQSALRTLVDENLFFHQNRRPKFLPYPICRYADENTMAYLTKQAPKWSTSVSGMDAPPIIQLRQALRYSNTRAAMLFADRCGELDKYAEMRGMTEDEMRDKYLSDVGLDEEGGKSYDLGNQTVTARLQKDMSYLFELPGGKTAKSLPKKGADGIKYAAAKADFEEMCKSTSKILKSRGKVLFNDFLTGRERDAAEWQEAYLKNPLLRKAASLVVWAQGEKTFTLHDGNPIDSGEQPYVFTEEPIRVAHPMEMQTNDASAWQRFFAAHDLKQPFVQIWEPIIDPATIRDDRYEGSILSIYRFANMDKHGIHSDRLGAYSESFGFTLDECSLEHKASVWRIAPDTEQDLTYTLGKFSFDTYNRKVNHIVSLLDTWTVKTRISKDDVSVMNQMDRFTLAQITEFIAAAQEANAVNVLAALLDYKKANFADFDPMAEFTLEW